MKFEYERLGKPMPGQEAPEEIVEADESEPTEAKEAESETEIGDSEETETQVEASESAEEEE